MHMNEHCPRPAEPLLSAESAEADPPWIWCGAQPFAKRPAPHEQRHAVWSVRACRPCHWWELRAWSDVAMRASSTPTDAVFDSLQWAEPRPSDHDRVYRPKRERWSASSPLPPRRSAVGRLRSAWGRPDRRRRQSGSWRLSHEPVASVTATHPHPGPHAAHLRTDTHPPTRVTHRWLSVAAWGARNSGASRGSEQKSASLRHRMQMWGRVLATWRWISSRRVPGVTRLRSVARAASQTGATGSRFDAMSVIATSTLTAWCRQGPIGRGSARASCRVSLPSPTSSTACPTPSP